MKLYEVVVIAILIFLIYKRVEGYMPVDNTMKFSGELADYYIPGGRPAEFFMYLSPNDWTPKSPGYIFDPTVEMDV
jgi:hypothetical protein